MASSEHVVRMNASDATMITVDVGGRSFRLMQSPSSMNHGLSVWDAVSVWVELGHDSLAQQALWRLRPLAVCPQKQQA